MSENNIIKFPEPDRYVQFIFDEACAKEGCGYPFKLFFVTKEVHEAMAFSHKNCLDLIDQMLIALKEEHELELSYEKKED